MVTCTDGDDTCEPEDCSWVDDCEVVECEACTEVTCPVCEEVVCDPCEDVICPADEPEEICVPVEPSSNSCPTYTEEAIYRYNILVPRSINGYSWTGVEPVAT